MKRSVLGFLATLCLAVPLLLSPLASGQAAHAGSWTPVTGGNVHYQAVDLFDALHGWVGGITYIPEGMVGFEDTGIISRTDSAGAEWESATAHELGPNLAAGWNFLTVTALDFVDDLQGWATLSDGTIVASIDGGAAWFLQEEGSQDYADNNWAYQDISMADATHGVAVGSWVGFAGVTYPRIVYTENGTDWAEADFEEPAGFVLESAYMVDMDYGWAVGRPVASDGMPLVLVTHDGGATWTRQTEGLPTTGAGFYGVCFTDRQHGWAVGGGGAIYATADSGVTWWNQPSDTTETLLDVCFAGPAVGYAVGQNGVILETTGSGDPWILQTTGSTVVLRAVATAGMVVLAVGDDGVILQGSVPPPSASGTGFGDIGSSPYKTAIETLALAGLVDGFVDGTFRPDAGVKRAQFAKMIVGALGIEPGESTDTQFIDLGSPDAGGYPHRWVQAAFDEGITYGTNAAGTLFAPWDPIRRDQAVSMIVRGVRSLMPDVLDDPPAGMESVFAGVGDPHGRNLRIAEYGGLLDGLSGMGAQWSVLEPATRGEVAQMLYNLLTQ